MQICNKLVVFGALFICGCAGTWQKADEPKTSDLEVEEKVEKKQETIVETDIDPDVLYYLMTAELAGQRGQYDVALEGYMRAARVVDDPRISERAAKIALYLKDYEQTEEAVDLWLQKEPDSLVARKIAAMSAIQNERRSELKEHLDYLLQADPAGFEKTLLELAKASEADGKEKFVYDVLEEMTQTSRPQQAELFFVQGLLAAQMQNSALAQEKVQKALELQPDWTKALIFKAQLAAQAGDMVQAEALLRDAIDEEPDNPQLKKLLAQILIKDRQYDEAAEVYLEILEANPEDSETRYALGLVYLENGEYGQSRDQFEQLLNKPGWQDQANLYLGRIAAEKKQTDAALSWFDNIKSGPLVFEAGINSVAVLISAQRYPEAETRLKELMARYPEKNIRLVLMQAELYSAQKQYQQAFDLLTDTLAKDPGQRELLYTRAMMAEKLDNIDAVESDLKMLIRQNPDDSNSLNALGYILVDRTDRYQEAEGYLQRAIELSPDEPVIIDSYGWLLFKKGDYKEAIEYLQRAYDQQKEGEIAAHLIEALWEKGRRREARNLFKEAQKTVADQEPLEKLQQRIPELN